MRFINKKYLNYYRKARTVQSIHSPFLYKLLMESIENKRMYNVLIELEQWHRARPNEEHMSPILLSWVFHWIRVVQPNKVFVDESSSEDLKWLVNRTVSNTAILVPFESSDINLATPSDEKALIVLSSNYLEKMKQLQGYEGKEIMIICIGMNNTEEVPKWVNLAVNLYDIQLFFYRPELSESQAFTVIEKRKKLVDLGFFP